MKKWISTLLLWLCLPCFGLEEEGLPLMYWQEEAFVNFGDLLSLKLVERIVQRPVRHFKKRNKTKEKKLLAVGSLLYFAHENDVLWGTGFNGKYLEKKDYRFDHLDIRAVRGPLTRKFLVETCGIECPEIYGDPGLLFPYFFPEFRKKENPSFDYIVIPHYSERKYFSKTDPHVVYPTDPFDEVIERITDSRFVISSSLHGIVLAEAFGIPARMLRVTESEPLVKYFDYYYGTGRPHFQFARSVDEALRLGGEPPFRCDLKKLYEAFPFEFWPTAKFEFPQFMINL